MLVVIEGVLAIIDGWIVDLKEHRLVKPSRACRKRSKEHIAKLNSVPLVNWETLYDEKCALKNITNDELFKHIKCERYEFAEMVDASTRFVNKSFKSVNKGKYVRTYFCDCHCICIGNRRNIFLRNIPSNANMIPESNIAAGVCNRTIRKDNSVLQRELKTHEFEFTKQDIDVLQRYTEVAEHFKMVGENYLTFIFNKASSIASEFLKKDFHDGYTCLVKNFDPDTIIKYGRRLGPSIYTFIHARKLSPFSGLEFLPHDDLLLLRDSSDPEKLLAVLGPLFRDLVIKNTHREYISRWLRMAALKYESWEDTSIPCPKKPVHTFRQLMDSVRCFIVFSLLCVVDNIPAAAKVLTADEQSRDMFFPWFKSIYAKAVNEENTEAHTFITANFVTQSVEIHGLYLLFGYIKDLRKDVHRDIELCVDMLSEWLSFGTISQVYYNGMGNRSVRIRDDLYRDSDIVNVFHVIDRSLLSSFFMGWRSPGYINDENIRATILKIVNRITKILMVAVWICPGLPLRFPELSILCFSGSNRNLYFDADERVFLIKSRYNKSHKFDSRILFLDVPVSAVLFWYIYILRPFIMSLYPVEVGRLEKALIVSSIGKRVGDSVFDEDEVDGIVAEEEEEDRAANYALYRDTKSMEVFYNHLDPAEFRETMLRSFVFIDTSNCGLMKRTHFSSVLSTYPKSVSKREAHKIRTFRQGLAALWRHFIVPSNYSSLAVIESHVAKLFGHSVQTDRSGYGVDRSRAVQHSTSESELDYYRAKILCQKFQRLTSPATTPPIADLRKDDKKEIEKPIGDIYDLMEAGSCLFGNSQFAFKSTDQSNFTATVLNGDRKLLALQAPTSFGKTVTYLLPMMVLAKTRPGKFIHFVSVPYVALKTATMKRVQQAGLVAADSSALGAIDFYTQMVTIDVIVGVFDGFAQDECVSMFSKWDVMYGGCRKLGYFVIDEFHVLEVEKHFRPALRKFKSLSWSSFLKVIALSATMPKQLCMDICRERGFSDVLIETSRYVNAVTKMPNVSIAVDIVHVKKCALLDKVYDLVMQFLENVPEKKAVFFFSNKTLLRESLHRLKDNASVVGVDADMEDEAKLAVFRDFENRHSTARVVLGTKLISNGLDCSSVKFVCLVDCTVSMIDYLQMTGRIRSSGYVRILTVGNNNRYFKVSSGYLETVDWDQCISKQIAKFYGLCYSGCILCCNALARSTLKELIDLRRQLDTPVCDEKKGKQSGIQNNTDGVNDLKKKCLETHDGFKRMKNLMLDPKTGLSKKSICEFLDRDHPLNVHFLGVPIEVLLDQDVCVKHGTCFTCFSKNDPCLCKKSYGKGLAVIIRELLVLSKIVLPPVYSKFRDWAYAGESVKIFNEFATYLKGWGRTFDKGISLITQNEMKFLGDS